jgi:hypothetical protein
MQTRYRLARAIFWAAPASTNGKELRNFGTVVAFSYRRSRRTLPEADNPDEEKQMKRARHKPRPRGGARGRGVQFFDYGPWRFNINKATTLAHDRRKYQPEMRRPTPDWIGPYIDIDFAHVDHTDATQPVIFATVVRYGRPERLLIDGNHRAIKAMRDQTEVPVVTLDLEDTLKVLSAPGTWVPQMREDGARLGLLPKQS